MRFLFAPFAMIFALAVEMRRRLYRMGVFKSVRLSKPVISVGNLTAGGTGKTPFVDMLIGQLESQGKKVGVLTRGYGRKSNAPVLVHDNSLSSDVGDEPLWLFRRHPLAQIAVGADRVEASRLISDCDVYILDDGYQHFHLIRDLDVVLLDATAPFWHYHMLPWGLARERWSSLRRADLVVLNRANQISESASDALADRVFKQGVLEVVEASQVYEKCSDLFTGQPMALAGMRVGLVSGIGNAASFEWVVKSAKGEIIFHEEFTDHAVYDTTMIQGFVDRAAKEGADIIVTTEKDAVKWRECLKDKLKIPLGVVSVKMAFQPPLPDLYDLAFYNFC